MSIYLTVGIWLNQTFSDEESTQFWHEQFTLLNQLLTAHHLPTHEEPHASALQPLDLTITSEIFPLHTAAQKIEQLSELRFSHLLEQSGNEGIYLPRPFPQPLPIPPESPLLGAIIGSSIQLQHECEILARLFCLYEQIVPLELQQPTVEQTTEWRSLREKFDTQGEWTLAASGCQKLFAAAQHSVATGCALTIS